MKGLIIKDFMLMKSQIRFVFVIIVMAIVISVSNNDISFILGYLTFVIPMFALGTVSYDEHNNGYAFLFTLPISKKTYVAEKYCFTLLLGLLSLLAALVISMLVCTVRSIPLSSVPPEASPIIFSAMVIIMSVMLPLQIKFGAEKSRIAMIIVIGIVFALGFGISKLIPILEIDTEMIIEVLEGLHIGAIIAAVLILSAVSVAISFAVSLGIMKKKEF